MTEKQAASGPDLLRRLNSRRVLDALREMGPSPRMGLVQRTGLSMPAVSKAAQHLVGLDLVEEAPDLLPTQGRPSRVYRLSPRPCFIGIVIDFSACTVVCAGLDPGGTVQEICRFSPPAAYAALLTQICTQVRGVLEAEPDRSFTVAVTVPGLVEHSGTVVFSPNLHLIDGRRVADDLGEVLGITVNLCHEERALCLAEQMFGAASDIADFAMIDVSAGLGMGVVSGGRYVAGCRGFGCELGHIVVQPGGRPCGCGNRGCLETVATDRAVLRDLSVAGEGAMDMDGALARVQAGTLDVQAPLAAALDHLATGIGTVINLFNPARIFVHGRMFELQDNAFSQLIERTAQRTLRPVMADCQIVRARGSKRLGAVACAIHQRLDELGPTQGT